MHRLAGITFHTQANIPLPGLLAPPFAAFIPSTEQGQGTQTDVQHHIYKILPSTTLAAPLTAAQRQALGRLAGVQEDSLDDPFPRAAPVRDYLLTLLERPQDFHLSLQDRILIGRDYAHHTLHLFYSDNGSGAPQSSPELNDLGWVFQIQPLDSSPQGAAPLLPAERQSLSQGIDFKHPEALEHPCLGLEPLRSWLSTCLERGDRVGIDLYLDGLVALNQSQQTMTYFYRPEFYLGGAEQIVGGEMRRIFATFLPDFDALLVHSSGLIYDGQAALFLAPDEGGKTTALRLAPGAQYLNDDQVILRRQEGRFHAHATPLGRLTSGPNSAPLGGLFLLQRDRSFRLEAITPTEVVQSLWNEYRVYAAFQPRDRKLAAFDLLYQACHQAPTYRLYFSRNHIDWPVVGAAMRD
jgi:hypothetical protein